MNITTNSSSYLKMEKWIRDELCYSGEQSYSMQIFIYYIGFSMSSYVGIFAYIFRFHVKLFFGWLVSKLFRPSPGPSILGEALRRNFIFRKTDGRRRDRSSSENKSSHKEIFLGDVSGR